MISDYKVRGRSAVAQQIAGKGPALLLLHGAGGNHHSYDELLPYLVGRQVTVPALPGRCGSEGHAPRSVGQAAEWLIDFISQSIAGPLVIAGHSYGGALAIELALRAGGRINIRALALMATGARLRVHPSILQITEAALARGEATALSSFTFRAGSDPALVARVDRAMRATPPEATDADWRAADAFDRMAELAEIQLPTLILAGSEDLLTPAKYARFMADNIPEATLSLMVGAGHMLPDELPAEVARELENFIAGLPPEPGGKS